MSGIRGVLIVDDSSVMRKIVERALRQAGLELWCMRPATASKGWNCWTRAGGPDSFRHQHAVDGRAGVSAPDACAESGAGVPVVMITTESSEEHVKQAIQAGAQGYIRKPFTAEQVKERVLPLVGAA